MERPTLAVFPSLFPSTAAYHQDDLTELSAEAPDCRVKISTEQRMNINNNYSLEVLFPHVYLCCATEHYTNIFFPQELLMF